MSLDFADAKRTNRDRVLRLLLDLQWHHADELLKAGGVRYGARLLELRRIGYDVTTRGAPQDGKLYRLRSALPVAPQQKRVKVLLPEGDARELLAGTVTEGARAALQDAVNSFAANRHKL